MVEVGTENSSAPEAWYWLGYQWGSGSNCEAGAPEGCFLRARFLALDIIILPMWSLVHGSLWGGVLCCVLSYFLGLPDGLPSASLGLAFCWLLSFASLAVSLAMTAFDDRNCALWSLWFLGSALGLVSTVNGLIIRWASNSQQGLLRQKNRTQRIMGKVSSLQEVWI